MSRKDVFVEQSTQNTNEILFDEVSEVEYHQTSTEIVFVGVDFRIMEKYWERSLRS